MVLAVAKAIEDGHQAVLCASTGNTSASAAAYAARMGLTVYVLVPRGSIAQGKLAQAIAHGARILAVQGSFDDALGLAQEITARHPIALVNSVNPHRIQGQKTGAFEIVDDLGDAPDLHCMPVGNAGNITAYWMGYRDYQAEERLTRPPRMFGFQAAGAAPIVSGAIVEAPGDDRDRDPDRQPRLLARRHQRPRRLRRRHPGRQRRADPRRLPPPRPRGRRLLRAGLGGLRGRAARPARARHRLHRRAHRLHHHRLRPQGPRDGALDRSRRPRRAGGHRRRRGRARLTPARTLEPRRDCLARHGAIYRRAPARQDGGRASGRLGAASTRAGRAPAGGLRRDEYVGGSGDDMTLELDTTTGPAFDRERIEAAVRELLHAIGEDPDREGLRDTPRRIAEGYAEVFAGMHADPALLLRVGFEEGHDEMVILRDILFFSMCEHHLLPFHGSAHVAYVPRGRVVGISKIARLVDAVARRPQLQERLTSQIADTLIDGAGAGRRRRRGAGRAPLHDDARHQEARQPHDHLRHARHLPVAARDPHRVPLADRPPGPVKPRP